jgi:alpha-tubulin suppressor-like RCC1 family protein
MLARVSISIALGLAACAGAPTYKCQTNAQCIDSAGATGICEADSYCSFADNSCSATSRRYAEGAGDGKAGTCVAPAASGCIGAVAGGEDHFCAVRNDGTVWCWGANDVGQLGDGSTTDRVQPVKVATPAGKTFLEVAASENHTCALAVDKTVWCWGGNDVGQLGVVDTNGDPVGDSSVPVQVKIVTGTPPSLTFTPLLAKNMSAGGKHVCAVDTAGGVLCWGENADGQCGQLPPSEGGVDDALTPTPVPGLAEGAVAVAVGDEHSVSLKDDGSVYAFGGNANGQLGNGTTNDSYMPIQSKITSVTSLAVGDEHTCAIKSDGSIWCWGYGSAIGLSTEADQPMPQRALTGKSLWAGGSAFQTCAVQADNFMCWGQNDEGQVGIGKLDPATILTPTSALLATVAHVGAATSATCAVTSEGQLWCWGANDRGQLAQGAVGESSAIPLRVNFACN